MIPDINDLLLGDRLDVAEVHHHAVHWRTVALDGVTGQRDLQRVAVAVEVAALAGVVGNAVARVEFQAARDTHGVHRS